VVAVTCGGVLLQQVQTCCSFFCHT
jgi:hypothetical protein